MSDRVQIDIDGGVAHVRMSRPEKMNALDGAMFRGLAEAGEAVKADPAIRAVVLHGEGRAFCAGLDFESFQAMAAGPSEDGAPAVDVLDRPDDRITHLGQQVAHVWQEVPVPVIAAVHGVALGGGCQIALGADLRIVTPDVRISVLEIKWGLIPDMTGTWMLPRLVGLDVAKSLTFTGRMVGGEEAVRIGLATEVAEDPLARATELAQEIASKSPHAMRAAKRLLNESGSQSIAEQFRREREEIHQLIGSPNQVEAVLAGMATREPAFTDPEA